MKTLHEMQPSLGLTELQKKAIYRTYNVCGPSTRFRKRGSLFEVMCTHVPRWSEYTATRMQVDANYIRDTDWTTFNFNAVVSIVV